MQFAAVRVPKESLRKAGEKSTLDTFPIKFMLAREVARKFVVFTRGNDELDLVAPCERREILHPEFAALARAGALHVDDLVDFFRHVFERTFAAGFNQHGVTARKQFAHQSYDFLFLQQRFATRDLHQPAIGRQACTSASTSSCVRLNPPLNVYSLSHQVQRKLHPAVRTKMHGSPANEDSPWSDL